MRSWLSNLIINNFLVKNIILIVMACVFMAFICLLNMGILSMILSPNIWGCLMILGGIVGIVSFIYIYYKLIQLAEYLIREGII